MPEDHVIRLDQARWFADYFVVFFDEFYTLYRFMLDYELLIIFAQFCKTQKVYYIP